MSDGHDHLKEGAPPVRLCRGSSVGSVDVPLCPGPNTIGRSVGCYIQLQDESVSDVHCQIEVDDGRVTVRDLGSTNGTLIDGEPVSAATLRHGQMLQIGQSEFWLADPAGEDARASAVEQDAAVAGPAAAAMAPGRSAAPAAWICDDCGASLGGASVKFVQLENHKAVALCGICGGLCSRPGDLTKTAARMSYGRGLLAALAYPLKGSALAALLAAGSLDAMAAMLGRSLLFSGMFMLLGVAVAAYALGFLREVLFSSAEGAEMPPAWPEYQPQALSETALQYVVVYSCSFGAWTMCKLWLGWDTPAGRWTSDGLLALGFLYFPMALLAVVIHDSLAGLNPLAVGISILRTGSSYWSLCLFLGAVGGAAFVLERVLAGSGAPLLRNVVLAFMSPYLAILAMRSLGWFYFCWKEQLAWT